jgi:hypothetical protein
VTELVQGVLQGAEGVQVAPPGGQQPHDRGIKKAAKALGFTRDEVRRSLKIDGICEAAKTKAKELGLDDNQSALLKIAEEDGEEAQLGLVEDIKSGKTSGPNIAAPGKRDPKKQKSLKPPLRIHRTQMSNRKSLARRSRRNQMRIPIPTHKS